MSQKKNNFEDEVLKEWIDSLHSVLREEGKHRAQFILDTLQDEARLLNLHSTKAPFSAYRNTISVEDQPRYPGDLEIEERITSIMRWNAMAMVIRANTVCGELGGHIASYASCAEIFEMGFNHFFRAKTDSFDGDLVYFQPHSAPGVYSRAFLEGRLSTSDLASYRQEVPGPGLCSYPHPWLMKNFWQFPTGSMGIGPISAIYQARFMRYLDHRGLADTSTRHVWGIFGDGEMDEPESLAALTLASRENLCNLTFIINCNLQRLDGPVRGNGQIIQELESLFIGAGWNVIKVLWGSEWDTLFAMDQDHVLLKKFAETTDGEYQNLGSKDGDYNRHKFFESSPEIAALVQHMTDSEINALKRGGHDFKKLYAAFASAKAHRDQPSVILAKTKKGFGLGGAGESKMTAHQAKKLDNVTLLEFRDRFDLPLTDQQVKGLDFFKPNDNSIEMQYLKTRRTELGGSIPKRLSHAKRKLPTRPKFETYAKSALQPNNKIMSTTMALVRIIGGLLRHREFGQRLVPIVADEARTFGMQTLFNQIGIYSPHGQTYEPEDAGSLVSYKETRDGQLIQEGITEAGAISSWAAAATAYSAHNTELVPMYIFYSMFGFQRIGDLIWAAADQRSRGFLFGATAGRTTLSGEGLQHQDGSSHLMASTIPNCRAFDPCFAYEIAVIIEHGLQQMFDLSKDEFFYITVMNENYIQPNKIDGIDQDIIRGIYQLDTVGNPEYPHIKLLGSGTILLQVIEAARLITTHFKVSCHIFSVTSYSELAREEMSRERLKRLGQPAKTTQIDRHLKGPQAIVAVTDYVRAVPAQISPYIHDGMHVLGTDGFGRSSSRDALRAFFEVNASSIALTAIMALIDRDVLSPDSHSKAKRAFNLEKEPDLFGPWER